VPFLSGRHLVISSFTDMFGAVVLVLSAWSDPPTAWRILPAKRYNDDYPWLVRELQVFASPDCTGDPIPASTPIGSSPHNLPRAVDGLYDSDHYWSSAPFVAGCRSGCQASGRGGPTSHEARGAWVGYEVLAADAKHGNCVKVIQGNFYNKCCQAKDLVLRIPCES